MNITSKMFSDFLNVAQGGANMLTEKSQVATGLSEDQCNYVLANMASLAAQFASSDEPEPEPEPAPEPELEEPEVEENGPSDSEIDEDIIEGKIEEFYEGPDEEEEES